MNSSYKTLFSQTKLPDPADDLFDKVIFRIQKEKRLAAKRRAILFAFLLVISTASLWPSFAMVRNSLSDSGFVGFLSLLFSDCGVVMTYWKNFIYTLLETLPVMSLSLFFLALFVFLQSIKLFSKEVKRLLSPTQIIHN